MGCAPALNKTEKERILKYDRLLEFRWNSQLDRWELWRKGTTTQKSSILLRLQNQDGSFRTLDGRLLGYLVNRDFWKMGKSTKQIAQEMQDYDDLQEKKKVDAIVYETGQKARYYRKFFARNPIG